MKKIMIGAFILLAMVQWFVPGNMICNKDAVLRNGKAFRFECKPVDPADPFRGRYITLRFKIDTFSLQKDLEIISPHDVYVILDQDANGFARIKDVTTRPPANDPNYVKARADEIYAEKGSKIYITYPFEEFYLQEHKARKAETAYLEALTGRNKRTYALVKVWNGDAVIENVFAGDDSLVK